MTVITDPTDCSPEETGFDSSRIDKLNERLESMINRRVIHGAAYCISHKGKIIAHAALGRANGVGKDGQMMPQTVFDIASLTKVFTATAIMQLCEDGVLNLNDPVSSVLPQFAEKPFSDIRIIHLLTHTSGLYPDGGCFPESAPMTSWALIDSGYKLCDNKEQFDWIAAGISAGLRRPVGSEWQYCSFGFALLGEIVSRVSGVNAHEFITKRITEPLGMKDTGFFHTKETAAKAFYFSKEGKEYLSQIASGERNALDGSGTFWDGIPKTAGGLFSTVGDLARFGDAFAFGGRLDGVRLLGRKSVEKISKVQLHNVPDYCWNANEPDRLYGVGFDIRRTPAFNYSDRTIMHEGAGASSLDIDLDEQLTAAWFVPFDEGAGGWSSEPLYNVQNIIWSGLI